VPVAVFIPHERRHAPERTATLSATPGESIKCEDNDGWRWEPAS
jgi:hypothetical protein